MAFFADFALTVVAFRGLVTSFFADLALLVARPVAFRAFLAGAFAAANRLPSDLGGADFGLIVRLLADAFGTDRREAERLIPFVTGLLIGTP